jgi:hypothetical protein
MAGSCRPAIHARPTGRAACCATMASVAGAPEAAGWCRAGRMAIPRPAPTSARTVATSSASNATAGENPASRHRQRDERLGGHLRQPYPPSDRQPMAGRNGQFQPLVGEQLPADLWPPGPRAGQDQVDIPAQQLVRDLLRQTLVQPELHPGLDGLERLDQVRDEPRAQGPHEPDSYWPSMRIEQPRDVRARGVKLGDDLDGMPGEHPAEHVEPHAVPRPVEQPDSELILQPPYRPGDRRLAEVQPGRRRGHVLVLRNGQEGLQVVGADVWWCHA